MTHITSPRNPRLKSLRRLATRRERERSGRFSVEGEDLIRAARDAGRSAVEGYRRAGSGLGEAAFHDVEPDVLAGASGLGSGARVIAVYEQRWLAAPRGPVCVFLLGVSDPGNVGTILRGAQAFGASSVALGPGCADPHSHKAVRASMGAIFAVPIARVGGVDELPGERVALVAGGGEPLAHVAASVAGAGAVTLLVGAEREGLASDVVGACERVAQIPIAAQSLNAAMAATVALYELARERAGASGGPPGGRTSRVRTS
jgi:RNA methyltransferase, TrmH family